MKEPNYDKNLVDRFEDDNYCERHDIVHASKCPLCKAEYEDFLYDCYKED